MDYLEGMLLHSWWGDTDYENRRHRGTWFFFSFLMFVFLAIAALKVNINAELKILEHVGWLSVITVLLFLITPFLCRVYYKTPLVLRVIILAVLALKYLSFFTVIIAKGAELLIIPEDVTISAILEWGNTTVGDFLTDTTAKYQEKGLFIGAFVIGALAVIIGLFVLAVLVFAPMLLLYAFNLCQYVWDKIFLFIWHKIGERVNASNRGNKILTAKKKTTQRAQKDIQ